MLNEFAPESRMEELEEGFIPEQVKPLVADEAASPEEEDAFAAGFFESQSALMSQEGTAAVVDMLRANSNEDLGLVVPKIVMPILQKAQPAVERETGGNPEMSGVWFGEGGLLQTTVDSVFEIATRAELPGADDPDQYAAALIGTYKAVGEYLLEQGDEDAIQEARELASEMVLTQDDGTVQSPEQYQKKLDKAAPVRRGVQEALNTGGANIL
jgi:hypothetical protein